MLVEVRVLPGHSARLWAPQTGQSAARPRQVDHRMYVQGPPLVVARRPFPGSRAPHPPVRLVSYQGGNQEDFDRAFLVYSRGPHAHFPALVVLSGRDHEHRLQQRRDLLTGDAILTFRNPG